MLENNSLLADAKVMDAFQYTYEASPLRDVNKA